MAVADWFDGGELGWYIDPAAPGVCFQDVAGTTPASVGDVVRRINAWYGGAYITIPTGAGWTLGQDGSGRQYCNTNGVPSIMNAAAVNYGAGNLDHLITFATNSTASDKFILGWRFDWSVHLTTGGYESGEGVMRLAGLSSTILSTARLDDGNIHTCRVGRSGTTVHAYLDGSDGGTAPESGTINVSAGRPYHFVNDYDGSSNALSAKFYRSVAINRLVTSAEEAEWNDLIAPGSATYAVSPDASSADEGSDADYSVATTAVADGTTLYWRRKATSTVTAADLVSGVDYGSFTINSNAGTFSVPVKNDYTTEGAETLIVEILTGSETGTVVDTATAVTINDTSVPSITPSADSVNEGATLNYTVHASDGTYGWSVGGAGNTASSSDIGLGSTYGSVTVTGGTGTINLTVTADMGTEGTETLVLQLWDHPWPDQTTVIATAAAVTINDTSTSAGLEITAVYSGDAYFAGQWAIPEGGTLGVTVTVNTVLSGLNWEITPASGDWSSTSGSVFLTPDGEGSVGYFEVVAVADSATEDLFEPFDLDFYVSGEFLVGSAPPIRIWDTSTAPPTWEISAVSTYQPDEGDTVNISVAATSLLPDGTGTGYWTLTPDSTVESGDFTGAAVSGSIPMTGDRFSSTGNLALTLVEDLLSEDQNLADSGTASGGTVSSLVDSTKEWLEDEHVGKLVRIHAGAGAGQKRVIASNAETALTPTVNFDTAPDATSQYQIIIEFFRVELRSGSVDGPVEDTTDYIVVGDTSLTVPTYAISQTATLINEGGGVTFTVTADWLLDDELFGTITGTATDADFEESIPVTITMTETVYPTKVGTVTLTASLDALLEGPQSFTFQARTGSAGGLVVVSADPVEITDENYLLVADKGKAKESQSVIFTATAINAADGTYGWSTVGSVDAGDFADATLTGTVTITGGVGYITRTLAADAAAEGAKYFYLKLHRTNPAGQQLTISTAVVVLKSAIDFDAWLSAADGVRVVLIDLYHADGVVRIANYPYVSEPGDSIPNQTWENLLIDAVDIEQRIDGGFSVGRIAMVNDGRHDDLLDYTWHRRAIEIRMGEPGWSYDDFRLIVSTINGGLDSTERGRLSWAVFDGKAVLAEPLQASLLANGNPIPIVLGTPFNVAPALIDQPAHEYQVNEGEITSLEVRSNGNVVDTTDNLAAGTFALDNNELGTICCDPVAAVQTPAAILTWLADRFGVDVNGDTADALPVWILGMYYNGSATGLDVIQHICDSIKGYWHRNALGQIEIYQLEAPAETADFVITKDDIEAGTLQLIGIDPPIKTVTVRYKRNFTPVARDSLAGILDTNGAFAETLVQEWRQVTATNSLPDYPQAGNLVVDTYLVSQSDAQTLANTIAALHAVERKRYGFTSLLSSARSTVGQTAEIHYPAEGFEAGRNARVIAVKRSLTKFRVPLEVWL